VLTLLPFLVALVVGPSPPPVPSLCLRDLASLTDAEARQLAGRRALFRVVFDGEPDGDPGGADPNRGLGGDLNPSSGRD
jgi:hypothetical protein